MPNSYNCLRHCLKHVLHLSWRSFTIMTTASSLFFITKLSLFIQLPRGTPGLGNHGVFQQFLECVLLVGQFLVGLLVFMRPGEMNIVKGVTGFILRSSGGQSKEHASAPQPGRFTLPTPVINFRYQFCQLIFIGRKEFILTIKGVLCASLYIYDFKLLSSILVLLTHSGWKGIWSCYIQHLLQSYLN